MARRPHELGALDRVGRTRARELRPPRRMRDPRTSPPARPSPSSSGWSQRRCRTAPRCSCRRSSSPRTCFPGWRRSTRRPRADRATLGSLADAVTRRPRWSRSAPSSPRMETSPTSPRSARRRTRTMRSCSSTPRRHAAGSPRRGPTSTSSSCIRTSGCCRRAAPRSWPFGRSGSTPLVPAPRRLVGGRGSAADYYGPPLRLADSARRLDTSPAWFSWVGTAPTLELVERIGVERIHEHDVELANRFRAGMGLEPGESGDRLSRRERCREAWRKPGSAPP